MDQKAIDRAADQLYAAHRNGVPLAALDEGCVPPSIADGHAVQDALIARLGEAVVGYKVAGLKPDEMMRGAILASRLLQSPARIRSSDVPLLGIELEIAFRFERAVPARESDYSYDEVRRSVVALPAIEVVATRFQSYKGTPVLHRLGDCMSNGALICGEPRQDWERFDLTSIATTLRFDGEIVARTTGGHAAGDPLLPAVALANALRSGPGIAAGQIVTTGTYTGLLFATPGSTVHGAFADFGAVEVHFGP